MKHDKLYEAFNYIDDWYLDIVDARQKENIFMKKENRHFTARRTFTLILAAALCISLLTITAAAAGWIPGLFKALKEKYPQDDKLFEAAAQANSDSVPEVFDIPQLDLSKFVLLEQYFDGHTILVGYDLDIILPDPVVGFEPGTELLSKIKNGTKMTEIVWTGNEAWLDAPDTENAIIHNLSADAAEMDRMLRGTLSETAYQKVWKRLTDQGHVCIAVRTAWLGDHILINGVDTVEAYLESNAYADRTDYTSDLGNCIRLEPVPEDIGSQDSVSITLNVRSSVDYWYMDLEGAGRIYYNGDVISSEDITFEIDKAK